MFNLLNLFIGAILITVKLAWKQQHNVALISWTPSREHALKINYDAALQAGWICEAAVCRNWKGEVLRVRFCKFRGLDPIVGETRAARFACSLAAEFTGFEICFEGDARNLVSQVVDSDSIPDWKIEAEFVTIRALLRLHPLCCFECIPREGNFLARELASWGMSKDHPETCTLLDIPSDIVTCDDSAVYRRVLVVG